jgi:hypothetical protein
MAFQCIISLLVSFVGLLFKGFPPIIPPGPGGRKQFHIKTYALLRKKPTTPLSFLIPVFGPQIIKPLNPHGQLPPLCISLVLNDPLKPHAT